MTRPFAEQFTPSPSSSFSALLGYSSFEIEWHIANPGKRLDARGTQMDEELKNLFWSNRTLPARTPGAAQRWLKERVVLAKVAEQLNSDAGAELPPELQQV
jgi:hypothetical protein